ncbi:MAG: H4MPT-linked C1 transfer pathway protein, partial [Methanocorpusculum sp.]|nr:H4MPT-linked C1 transfer pathway protein [Methanocorpusculum sp.]
EEIGEMGAASVAESFWQAQRKVVCDAVESVKKKSHADKILVGGIGSHVFAPFVNGSDLTKDVGVPADALPAYAVWQIGRRL